MLVYININYLIVNVNVYVNVNVLKSEGYVTQYAIL